MKKTITDRIHDLFKTNKINYQEFDFLLELQRNVDDIEIEAQKYDKHNQMRWSDYVQLGILTSKKK